MARYGKKSFSLKVVGIYSIKKMSEKGSKKEKITAGIYN